MPVFLQAIKPGLLSKDEEVALWACRLMAKLFFEFANVELIAPAWEWFCKENGGLFSCILCLKRFNDLKDNIANIFLQIGRFNLAELITVQMRKVISDQKEYIDVVHMMLKPFADSKISKEEVNNIFFNLLSNEGKINKIF